MHIDAGVVKLNDLLDWREVHEEDFRYLSIIARYVLCVPATSVSSEINFV
jgi:hypothetical protein